MPVDPKLVRALFLEAAELPQAERDSFLNAHCGGDAGLRPAVDRLLAAHQEPASILEPNTGGTAESRLDPILADPKASVSSELATGAFEPDDTVETFPPVARTSGFIPGRIIGGRYALLEILGEGGMGTVYRAQQSQPVKRIVALKLIKLGMDSRTVLARFDAERQALALMDHPNIARVYDGGATDANQPFFVMEFVHGLPITDYCDEHRLSVEARLHLFVAVCQAVQHAHQKGIIHRDLKPSNVMVTEVDGRPTPKVIDFGVAKATESRLTDQSLGDTGAIVGTPTYMSPEQADPSSMDIDTRTDIYALGVILYELLAGSPPLDASQFRRGAILEMLRMVREVDPSKPSTKVSTADALPSIAANRAIDPDRLMRALRGDLDWIVMKALEKDRTRRYETANGFAADIQRHLASEPVLAAPPSRSYRLRKFVRKNRGGVIAASLVLLTLLGGIAGTTFGLLRAEERRLESDRARVAEAQRVRERDEALRKEAQQTELANHRAYASSMLLAQNAWDTAKIGRFEDLLDLTRPQNQQVQDLRGFEWYYLNRKLRARSTVLSGPFRLVVSSVAISPDNKWLAAVGDGKLGIWERANGRLRQSISTPGAWATQQVVFAPDSSVIATASSDGVRLWRVPDAQPVVTFRQSREGQGCQSVQFSHDGSRLVTGHDEDVRLWDVATGRLLETLDAKKSDVKFAAPLRAIFGPGDRSIIAAAGFRGGISSQLEGTPDAILSWEPTSPPRLRAWTAGQSGVQELALSPDGNQLATAGSDKTVKLWDLAAGREAATLHGHEGSVYGLSYSPDGSKLATASYDQTVRLWNTKTHELLENLRGHRHIVWSVMFAPDGNSLASSASDSTVRCWPVEVAPNPRSVRVDAQEIRGLAVASSGQFVVACGRDKKINLRDSNTAAILRSLEEAKPVGRTSIDYVNVAINADGSRTAALSSWPAEIHLWDNATGKLLRRMSEPGIFGSDLSFSPDGRTIWAGYGKEFYPVPGRLVAWDVETGTRQRLALERRDVPPGRSSAIRDIRLTPSGQVVWAGIDGAIGRYDLDSNRPSRTEMKPKPILAMALSPDGTRVAFGGGFALNGVPEDIVIQELESGREIRRLRGHDGVILDLDFDSTGSRIASTSEDGTVRVWDTLSGQEVLILRDMAGQPVVIRFNPTGDRLYAGLANGTLVMWNASK